MVSFDFSQLLLLLNLKLEWKKINWPHCMWYRDNFLERLSQFFASFVLARIPSLIHPNSTWFSSLQVLASLLYRWLMDTDKVCSVCEAKLSSESQRSIAMFAEIVWHVLVNLGRTEGWWDHRVLLCMLSSLWIQNSQVRKCILMSIFWMLWN